MLGRNAVLLCIYFTSIEEVSETEENLYHMPDPDYQDNTDVGIYDNISPVVNDDPPGNGARLYPDLDLLDVRVTSCRTLLYPVS